MPRIPHLLKNPCLGCGGEIWTRGKTAKYCSWRCNSRVNKNAKGKTYRRKVLPHGCENCGGPIVSSRPNTRFCSYYCNHLVWSGDQHEPDWLDDVPETSKMLRNWPADLRYEDDPRAAKREDPFTGLPPATLVLSQVNAYHRLSASHSGLRFAHKALSDQKLTPMTPRRMI